MLTLIRILLTKHLEERRCRGWNLPPTSHVSTDQPQSLIP